MSRKLRMIGGPEHGKFVALESHSDRYCTLERTPFDYVAAAHDRDFRPEHCRSPKRIDYRIERIQLSRNTRVEVLVREGMSEDEVGRRLADLIEGTHER